VNLRKDHCRNLPQQNDQRTRLLFTIVVRRLVSGDQPTPGAERAKEYRIETAGRPCTVIADRSGGVGVLLNKIRLSATDISALASMKNVAKCDTWCELQNPVNHRVFERKLRPKPLGRGHVCLGVTHRVAPLPGPSAELGERMVASRAP
jgi:hypothetical protein